jgi:integrase/recombinase XerC
VPELAPIFEDYLDLLEQSSARQTYSNNHRSFELYCEFLASRGLDETAVAFADLRDWLKELISRYKPGTVSRHVISVRAAYQHAHRLGNIENDPTSGIGKLIPRPVDKLPETLTAEQIRACHRNLQGERESLIFHLLLFTGCRAAELRPLRWEAGEHSYVDFDNDQLVIYGKNSKIRFVPLHPILRTKLEDARASVGVSGATCVIETRLHAEMSHTSWTTEVTRILSRAGVETEKKSHVFRKSLNTNLLRQGVAEHVLDSLFGWAPATVRTKHYSGVAKDEVREAILQSYSDDPVVPEQRTGVIQDAMIDRLQAEIERLKELKKAVRA